MASKKYWTGVMYLHAPRYPMFACTWSRRQEEETRADLVMNAVGYLRASGCTFDQFFHVLIDISPLESGVAGDDDRGAG